MTGWFTQPRLDLGGASTQDMIARAIDCLACIGAPAPDDGLAASMHGHAVDGARYALDDLIADPPFGVVVRTAGLDPAGLLRAFDLGRFDAVRADLNRITAVGVAADLPEGEVLAREAIRAQADFDADLEREFLGALAALDAAHRSFSDLSNCLIREREYGADIDFAENIGVVT